MITFSLLQQKSKFFCLLLRHKRKSKYQSGNHEPLNFLFLLAKTNAAPFCMFFNSALKLKKRILLMFLFHFNRTDFFSSSYSDIPVVSGSSKKVWHGEHMYGKNSLLFLARLSDTHFFLPSKNVLKHFCRLRL